MAIVYSFEKKIEQKKRQFKEHFVSKEIITLNKVMFNYGQMNPLTIRQKEVRTSWNIGKI